MSDSVEVEPTEWDEQWSTPVEEREEEPQFAEDTPEEIRKEVRARWEDFRRYAIEHKFSDEALTHGTEKAYSTSQTAAFFGRSPQWIYWGLHPDPETGEQVFTYKDGSPIIPERAGNGGWRRFTLPIIREIALSHFRRGNLTEQELQEIMAKVLLAEFGPQAFADKPKGSKKK